MKWVRWLFPLSVPAVIAVNALTGHFWWSLAVFPLCHAFPLYAILRRNCQWLGPVVTRIRPADSVWLTIDDGPSQEITRDGVAETEGVLDVLDRYDAKATFFMIGEAMRADPKGVQSILDRGHSLGNHTSTHAHAWFWSFTKKRLAREIDEWSDSQETSLFRSPVGMKPLALYPVLELRNLTYIGWSAAAYDGVTSDLDTIMARLKKKIEPGAILVIHEGLGHAPALLERLLPFLEEQGLKCALPNPRDFLTQ